MRVILLLSVLFVNLFEFEALAGSFIYKWRDEQGRLHFTDTPETIPDRHWNQLSKSTRLQAPDGQKGSRMTRVSLERNHGAILLPVWVNVHHRWPFFLDTGSTYSQITPEDVVALKLDADRLPPVKVQTADGRSLQTQMVILDSLKIGSFEVHDLEALVGDVRLLGLNALERFRMTIDLQRSELILEPPLR